MSNLISLALRNFGFYSTYSFLGSNSFSVLIQRWLHLHYSTLSPLFYSSVSLCPLPIKSWSSALKASEINGHLLLKSSHDSLVSGCTTKLQTGNWKVEDAVLCCENGIKISQVCRYSHHNRHDFAYTTTPEVLRNKYLKH